MLTSSCINRASESSTSSNTEHSTSVKQNTTYNPDEAFKTYWYSGEAEITSYTLEQARYGELRDGHAVMVFVTEDFLPEIQVKANQQHPENISIMKLNATKTFNTGIYPYSIMQSTFYPVANDQHALKVSCSVQEWCGQVYTQINNRDRFEITSHSYFEGEADQSFSLHKTYSENELWTQLRIDPTSLPTGEFEMIPSLEFIRLKHIELKAYKAKAKRSKDTYSILYPELRRSLSITFNPEFPYDIKGWQESFKDGYGSNVKNLTTKATVLKTIKSAYWNKNANKDSFLRDSLQLR